MREYGRIWSLVGNRQIEELVDLPLMTDPDILDVLDVLTEAVTPAMYCDENLFSLVICHMVNLSLEHGNCDGSCFAYVWFAVIAGPRFGKYKDGFRFGRLGYELVEKRGLIRYQARTYMSFGNMVIPWARHALEGRELARRAFDAAYRIGDLTFAAYSCTKLITNFLTVGDPLAEVQPEAEKGLAFAQRARFGLVVDLLTPQVGMIRTLRGLTPKFGSFDDEQFDELQFERHLASNPTFALPEFWYLVSKGASPLLCRRLRDSSRCIIAGSTAALHFAVTARDSRVSLLWRAFARRILEFRISRSETAAFRGSDGSPQAARNMGGALPGEF